MWWWLGQGLPQPEQAQALWPELLLSLALVLVFLLALLGRGLLVWQAPVPELVPPQLEQAQVLHRSLLRPLSRALLFWELPEFVPAALVIAVGAV
jgi:hypothetical protein